MHILQHIYLEQVLPAMAADYENKILGWQLPLTIEVWLPWNP